MLLVVASTDAEPIPPGERCKLEQALAQPHQSGLVNIEPLSNASGTEFHQRIEKAYKSPDPVNIIHFLCHGEAPGLSEFGKLRLQDEQAETGKKVATYVTADELANWLGPLVEHGLRLVILSACCSARTHEDNLLRGVAQALVTVGIPAVIGMQWNVNLDDAGKFAREFYRALFASPPDTYLGCAFEDAFGTARRTLECETGMDSGAWGAPTLYTIAGIGNPFPFVMPLEGGGGASAQYAEHVELADIWGYLANCLRQVQGIAGKPLGDKAAPEWDKVECRRLLQLQDACVSKMEAAGGIQPEAERVLRQMLQGQRQLLKTALEPDLPKPTKGPKPQPSPVGPGSDGEDVIAQPPEVDKGTKDEKVFDEVPARRR